MSAKLVAEEGEIKGAVLSLEGEEPWLIGSDPETCQVVIEDEQVPPKQCKILPTPEGYFIEPLEEEASPFQVNGEEISEKTPLFQGDTIFMGSTLLRFYEEAEAQVIEDEEEEVHDTIFEEEDEEKDELAEVNFDLMGTGRWLLKVVRGPNSGAEFSMHADDSYVVGTDPNSCDIVFHDTSVSRQHARVLIDKEDHLSIEDLGSRNGTLIDGKKLSERAPLELNTVITMGTTSFMVFDREGEMETIISPVITETPREAKREAQPEEEAIEGPSAEVHEAASHALKESLIKPSREKKGPNVGTFVLIGIVTGLFVIVGIGVSSLFYSEPIVVQEPINIDKRLKEALAPFPFVKHSFNKSTGKLLLVGHVLTPSDRNQLLYNLQGLKFIKSIDDAGIIVDEYIWREINQVINRNRAWRGINVHSPTPGRFVLTGYLKTRKEAEQLSDYVSTNFPYIDLLEKKVIVEENVINTVTVALRNHGLDGIKVEMSEGLLTLTGGILPDQRPAFNTLTEEFRSIPGVRSIKTFVSELTPEKKIVDISDKYTVSGVSQVGANVSVIVNGKILSKGDKLDGMLITNINRNTISLEKDGVQYRINFK